MKTRAVRRLLRFLSALLGIVVGVTVASFLARPADPSAAYFPTSKVVVNPDIPQGVARQISSKTGAAPATHVPHGPVYRPNPNLTPGAVAVTDTRAGWKNALRSSVWHQTGYV